MCGGDASQRAARLATVFARPRAGYAQPLSRDLAQRAGGAVRQQKKRHTEAAQLCALAMMWADAIPETHSIVRPFIDPSALGSDPESWFVPRSLRGEDRRHTHEHRLGSRATNGR